MTSSEGTRTTTSSHLSQFGIYKSIDARTEEFLRLSRKRQLRQGCACAALTTAITVTVVVTGLLVYEYTTTLDVRSHHEPGRSNWHGLFNNSGAFDPRNKVTVDPTTLKLLPILLNALNHNRYLEKFLEEFDNKKIKDPMALKQTTENSFAKHLLPTTNKRTSPNIHVKYNLPLIKTLANNQNLELFQKNKHSKHQERVLKYFNKMIDGKKGSLSLSEKENTKSSLYLEDPTAVLNKRNRTITRESKAHPLLERKKGSKPTPRIAVSKINETLFLFRKSTTETTLRIPQTNSYSAYDFTDDKQVLKSLMTKTKGNNCTCSNKLLKLIQKLILNIQDLIPELILYEKRCNTTSTLVTSNTTTFLTSNQLKITTTEAPTTTQYTTESSTTLPPNRPKPRLVTDYGKELFQNVLQNSTNEKSITEDKTDIKTTTIINTIDHTYSLPEISTIATQSPFQYWNKPLNPIPKITKASNLLNILNNFKNEVQSNLGFESENDLDFSKIINNNKNKLQKSLEDILNPQTLAGYNRMKINEEETEPESINSFKSIMYKAEDNTLSTPKNRDSQNYSKTVDTSQMGKTRTKSTHDDSMNNISEQSSIDEVFKKYAELNALISQTQNMSHATMYEIYMKKQDENCTASDIDNYINDVPLTENPQASELRQIKDTYDKYDTITRIPETQTPEMQTELNHIISMLPVSRSSYLEIRRSVPKQYAPDYDNTDQSTT